MRTPREPGFLQSLLPMAVLVVLLAVNVLVFGDSGLDGPNQLALLFAAAVALVVAASATLATGWWAGTWRKPAPGAVATIRRC